MVSPSLHLPSEVGLIVLSVFYPRKWDGFGGEINCSVSFTPSEVGWVWWSIMVVEILIGENWSLGVLSCE